MDMNAENFYIVNYRSKFNPCFKENRKIEQYTFDDMIEFAERYNEAQNQLSVKQKSKYLVSPNLLFNKGIEYAYELAKESHVDVNGVLTVSLDALKDVAKTYVKYVTHFLSDG